VLELLQGVDRKIEQKFSVRYACCKKKRKPAAFARLAFPMLISLEVKQ
jgi:hypothetical protein